MVFKSTHMAYLSLSQCPSKITAQPGCAFRNTLEFPDAVLQFARTHPLMWRPVYPSHRQPLLLRTGAPYKLTQITVDRTQAEDGYYDVMFIGTGERERVPIHHLTLECICKHL